MVMVSRFSAEKATSERDPVDIHDQIVTKTAIVMSADPAVRMETFHIDVIH